MCDINELNQIVFYLFTRTSLGCHMFVTQKWIITSTERFTAVLFQNKNHKKQKDINEN